MKYVGYLFLTIIGFILLIFSSFHLNFFSIKESAYKKYPNLNIRKYLFKNEPVFNKLNNDYNVKFIPFTELIKLDFQKKKINFDKKYYEKNSKDKNISYGKYGSFYLDLHNENVIITDFTGNNYYLKKSSLLKKEKNLNLNFIKNNISNIERIYDSYIINNEIFIAYVKKIKNCKKIFVSRAKINTSKIKYDDIFVSKTCHEKAGPGRIISYKLENKNGLLLSISSGAYNAPSMEAQNKSEIYGKIIFIDIKTGEHEVISLGHRVIQGLVNYKGNIIATEHGPRGGDEINIIKKDKNYGWPISSYGEKYDFKYDKKPIYKKSHSKYGFEEPILTYMPAIGISEIIKLPDYFSEMMQNVFIVSSLNGKSIFLTKFDNKYSRVIYSEKVFLNERIRDIKYEKNNNLILLAFEENGEIGILKKIN